MDSSSRNRKRSHPGRKMPKDYCDDDDADEGIPAKKCGDEDVAKCSKKTDSAIDVNVDPDEYVDEETAQGVASEHIQVNQDVVVNTAVPVDEDTSYGEDVGGSGIVYEAVDTEGIVDEATNYDGYFDNDGAIGEAPDVMDPYDAINDVKGVKLLDDKASIMKGVKHFYEEDKDKLGESVSKRRKLTAMENEVNQLKQFLVLDEVNQGTDKEEEDDSSDSEYDGVSDEVPSEEIEAMLNADMPGEYSRPPRVKPCPYDQRKKIVLEEKGVNHFEVLPLGWLVVPHHSGMPLYLHKVSRVCTLAKPYFLGPGSARKHEIPISAIPCYNYRRALEEEQKADSLGDAASYLRKLADPAPPKRGISVATNLTIVPEKRGFETTAAAPEKDGYEATVNVSEIAKNTTPVIAHVQLSNGIPSGSGITSCPFKANLPVKDSFEATANSSGKEGYEASPFANISGKYGYESYANTQRAKESYEATANSSGKDGYEATSNVPGKVGFEATANVPGQEGYEATATNGTADTSTMNHKLLRKLVNTDPIANGETVLPMMPNAKVETAQENWRKFHLKHEEVTDYCKKLFKFKCISIMRFKSWSERRKFTKSRKALQRPTLPDGTKLITFPVQTISTNVSDGAPPGALGGGVKAGRKECLMNPSGKSYVCILHEYMQRALKKQPTYEFKELENGATPYSATVSIDEMRYGIGYGTSKRQAKSAAAKAAIEILIPEMRDKIMQDKEINGLASRSSDRDLAFFDDIMIEDPRVADFCAKTMEPSPHNVLQTCLARNFGIGDRDIKYEINTLKHQKNQFTMTVGKHTATVICKNKRDGKQRASQAILQALHPNITSWGSLLRLYGTRSVKSFKEKKQEEQEITLLQSRAAINQPNHAILEKLNMEMVKLREMDVEVNPIANYICEEDLPTHSGSNLANVDL